MNIAYSSNFRFSFMRNEIFDFEPTKTLGCGSYGAVFKCWSNKFKLFFAVKKSELD